MVLVSSCLVLGALQGSGRRVCSTTRPLPPIKYNPVMNMVALLYDPCGRAACVFPLARGYGAYCLIDLRRRGCG